MADSLLEIVWWIVTLDMMVRPLPLDSHVEIPFDSAVWLLLDGSYE